MLVKNIIYHSDHTTFHLETYYTSDKPVEMPYLAGKVRELFQDFTHLDTIKHITHSIFNDSGLGKIELPIGKNELYYLELRAGAELTDIFTQPESLSVDIFVGAHYDHYIYSFYNNTDAPNISITAKMVDMDKNGFANLKANLDDLAYRQYILKKMLAKSRASVLTIPMNSGKNKHMTVQEVADYLNRKKGTIYNWVNKKKIPFHKTGRSLLFKINEIDEWIDGGAKKAKNKK